MGRYVGGHTHGDAGCSIDQHVGQSCRKNGRLTQRVVEVWCEVDGVLVYIRKQFIGDGGQPGFGVPHSGRRVAVDAAEVALPCDERVAHGEILGQTDEGVVHGPFTMGMELAQHFSGDPGALSIGAAGADAHVVHRV